jgi:hypothetical protein
VLYHSRCLLSLLCSILCPHRKCLTYHHIVTLLVLLLQEQCYCVSRQSVGCSTVTATTVIEHLLQHSRSCAISYVSLYDVCRAVLCCCCCCCCSTIIQAPNVLHQPLAESKIKHLHGAPTKKEQQQWIITKKQQQPIVHNLCPGSSYSHTILLLPVLLLLLLHLPLQEALLSFDNVLDTD